MVRITEQLVRKKSEHNELLINTLEELSLHQEDIECIEHLQNWCRELKILLLQSNLITKIENLHKLKRLEYLNLAINNIERIENLEKLESLNKLDLTLNFVGELTSIESLRNNYNLRSLILTGNPCCDYPNYREYVIAILPQLDSLDCKEITLTQKLQAKFHLKSLRAVIVQEQAVYAMKRDEQKLRVLQQKEELEAEMAGIADEDERLKCFWNAKSENCPEIRTEIAKYHRKSRETINDLEKAKTCKETKLFAPCGRPYNLNKPQLPFTLNDEEGEYVLKLEVYKFLDTSYIQVQVEVNFIRVTVKAKIFQIVLRQEVKPSEASVQRSQITGQLVIKVAKLHANEILMTKTKDKLLDKKLDKGPRELKGTVQLNAICNRPEEQIPDLI